ncbi:MAG: hypothetical protein ACP5VE_00185 [Chthonomonadales bacterium]
MSRSTAPHTHEPGAAVGNAKRASWWPAILAAAAYPLFWQVVRRIHTDSEGAVLLSTVASLAIIITFTAQFARAIPSGRVLVMHILMSSGIAIPVRLLLAGHPSSRAAALVMDSGIPDLLFVWFAASLGSALSLLIRAANMIPPVAAVLALVDVWTVLLGGPVHRIMVSPNRVAQAVTRAMTVELPAPSAGAAPIQPISVVGFADFLFIAFFTAAVCRYMPSPNAFARTLKALILVLCAYMLLVHLTGWALPALLPMAVVMIALHWRHFHYNRSEAFALAYAAVFIALIATGFWLMSRRSSAMGPMAPARPPARSSPL